MEMNWRDIIASYLESVTLSELCWLVISKREGIGFLEEEGLVSSSLAEEPADRNYGRILLNGGFSHSLLSARKGYF